MADGDAIALLEEALHLLQNGERAPGGDETWADWGRKAERFLRERPAAPAADGVRAARQPARTGIQDARPGPHGGHQAPQGEARRVLGPC